VKFVFRDSWADIADSGRLIVHFFYDPAKSIALHLRNVRDDVSSVHKGPGKQIFINSLSIEILANSIEELKRKGKTREAIERDYGLLIASMIRPLIAFSFQNVEFKHGSLGPAVDRLCIDATFFSLCRTGRLTKNCNSRCWGTCTSGLSNIQERSLRDIVFDELASLSPDDIPGHFDAVSSIRLLACQSYRAAHGGTNPPPNPN
jgi:hypothetical protein